MNSQKKLEQIIIHNDAHLRLMQKVGVLSISCLIHSFFDPVALLSYFFLLGEGTRVGSRRKG
jgi:hypothetical protein